MIKAGLEEEAYNLKDNKDLNTLNTVGYKEFLLILIIKFPILKL